MSIYIPDRVIVRKIKEYDPFLFVEWNNQKGYWEIWRTMPHGRRLITPVTESIYDSSGKLIHAHLDERILWWLYEADSWKTSPRKDSLERDRRWIEFQKQLAIKRKKHYYELGKDMWQDGNAFYASKHAKKNPKGVKELKPKQTWLRPDIQSSNTPRLHMRSRANALKYNFKTR